MLRLCRLRFVVVLFLARDQLVAVALPHDLAAGGGRGMRRGCSGTVPRRGATAVQRLGRLIGDLIGFLLRRIVWLRNGHVRLVRRLGLRATLRCTRGFALDLPPAHRQEPHLVGALAVCRGFADRKAVRQVSAAPNISSPAPHPIIIGDPRQKLRESSHIHATISFS